MHVCMCKAMHKSLQATRGQMTAEMRADSNRISKLLAWVWLEPGDIYLLHVHHLWADSTQCGSSASREAVDMTFCARRVQESSRTLQPLSLHGVLRYEKDLGHRAEICRLDGISSKQTDSDPNPQNIRQKPGNTLEEDLSTSTDLTVSNSVFTAYVLGEMQQLAS